MFQALLLSSLFTCKIEVENVYAKSCTFKGKLFGMELFSYMTLSSLLVGRQKAGQSGSLDANLFREV